MAVRNRDTSLRQTALRELLAEGWRSDDRRLKMEERCLASGILGLSD